MERGLLRTMLAKKKKTKRRKESEKQARENRIQKEVGCQGKATRARRWNYRAVKVQIKQLPGALIKKEQTKRGAD